MSLLSLPPSLLALILSLLDPLAISHVAVVSKKMNIFLERSEYGNTVLARIFKQWFGPTSKDPINRNKNQKEYIWKEALRYHYCTELTSMKTSIWQFAALSIEYGDDQTIQRLINKKPELLQFREGEEGLIHLCCHKVDFSIFKVLLNHPKVQVNLPGKYGRTVIHTLCWASNAHALQLLQLLIQHPGINVRATEHIYGQTALHVASSRGFNEAIKLLLAKGISVNFQDRDGFTALHIAAEKENIATCQLLLDQGADINLRNFANTRPYDVLERKGLLSRVNIANTNHL